MSAPNFNLVGMWLRDAAYTVAPYGYRIRVKYCDGICQPDEYEPNWTYRRERINVAVEHGHITHVYGVA